MTLQEKYEKQKEINKELVDENEALKFAARMSEKTELQLRAEIEEFKETNHELAELAIERQKEIDELEKCRQILFDCTDRQRKENAELKEQIEKLKADINEAIEDANRWKETETFSVLNRIYNDNFEVITSVSN